jgi:hypothetical protein
MPFPRRRLGKFGSTKTRYGGGLYDSKMEAGYAAYLDILKKSGEVVSWRRQVRVPLNVNGYHICDYYCDFVVGYSDGRTEWHEVKGFFTDTFRLKEKLFYATYPDRILRLVKGVRGSYHEIRRSKNAKARAYDEDGKVLVTRRKRTRVLGVDGKS